MLTGRYLRLLLRDQRNLLILLGQVPLIGLAIGLLFEAGLFAQASDGPGVVAGNPDEQIQLLFLLVTTAIWFGSIDGSREIVKERSVASREADVGVRLTARTWHRRRACYSGLQLSRRWACASSSSLCARWGRTRPPTPW